MFNWILGVFKNEQFQKIFFSSVLLVGLFLFGFFSGKGIERNKYKLQAQLSKAKLEASIEQNAIDRIEYSAELNGIYNDVGAIRIRLGESLSTVRDLGTGVIGLRATLVRLRESHEYTYRELERLEESMDSNFRENGAK